ncbi:MAG: SDR family oxidoreductase [Bauldia sp.]|nr:SDR family oxidoreductase [Bauldia sp.]
MALENPPTILITGCSSGIGHHCANGLKARGWRVFAAARQEADVARTKAEGLEAVRLDYTDAASIAEAVETVLTATGGELDAIFHNGGFAQPGAIEDLPTEALRAQFETNLFGWHELTRRIVPVMRGRGHGRIVFCSSVLGFVPARFRGAYVASKHAVEGYADTLRLELAGTGIGVSLIEPGPIVSRFRQNAVARIGGIVDVERSVHRAAYERDLAGREPDEAASPFRRGPEVVLARLVHALESPRPRPRYRVTVPAHVAAVLKRILPTRGLDWVVRRTGR